MGLPLADTAWEVPPPGGGLATISPVDDVQVVQVIHCVQHPGPACSAATGEKETRDGRPGSTRPSQAARGLLSTARGVMARFRPVE